MEQKLFDTMRKKVSPNICFCVADVVNVPNRNISSQWGYVGFDVVVDDVTKVMAWTLA